MEDCYTVDFIRNAGLLGQLEDFISSKVKATLPNLSALWALAEKSTALSQEQQCHLLLLPRSYP